MENSESRFAGNLLDLFHRLSEALSLKYSLQISVTFQPIIALELIVYILFQNKKKK